MEITVDEITYTASVIVASIMFWEYRIDRAIEILMQFYPSIPYRIAYCEIDLALERYTNNVKVILA